MLPQYKKRRENAPGSWNLRFRFGTLFISLSMYSHTVVRKSNCLCLQVSFSFSLMYFARRALTCNDFAQIGHPSKRYFSQNAFPRIGATAPLICMPVYHLLVDRLTPQSILA